MTTTTTAGQPERDVTTLSAIPTLMIEAWNRADGAGFAASFTDTADFIGYDGTHLTGRDQIAAYHQYLFDTEMKGSRITGEVRFVRLITADSAIIHTHGS